MTSNTYTIKYKVAMFYLAPNEPDLGGGDLCPEVVLPSDYEDAENDPSFVRWETAEIVSKVEVKE